RAKTILTQAGYITITRGRARRPDGTRYFPLDERLGLAPHHEASPLVRRRGCELAAEHPYREAARLLSAEVGASVDHRAIWRWVQADGGAQLKARVERVNAMFSGGETWIKHLALDWLPGARYQCHHWHLATKVREFCERQEPRFRRMLDRAFSDPHRLAVQLLQGRWRGNPERAYELAIYLQNNGDH